MLVIEYEGTRYHGFQIQANAPTIQGELERALFRLTGETIRVKGAGRTDAGVHAKGQVVTFVTRSELSPGTFVRALNFYLPRDIAVRTAYTVSNNFDVRRDARSREYRYYILNRATPSPLWQRYAYFVAKPLYVEAMNNACQILIGRHDFTSFSSYRIANAVRTVYKAEVRREGDLVTFDMVADSFLPHQVRNTVGALIDVGLGNSSPREFCEMARAREPGSARPTAPAHGLYLMKVNYPNSEGIDENL